MAQSPTKEGKIPFKVPSVEKPCFTYYKIIGELSQERPAVVMLHGGPGAGHEYLLPFAELWTRYGLPVVFYDQIGCASSAHLPETAGDKSLWQERLFIDELNNLLDHLKLRDSPGFHILGQSWGGMFGAAFAASRPPGLQRLVLASALASKELSIQSTRIRRKELPPSVQQTLSEAEEKDDYESPAYKEAMGVFSMKHLCRVTPFPPPELVPALKNLTEDKTVYGTMNGPSPIKSTGSMIGWTSIPRLPQITAPTLVYNGEHDTSHDVATAPFFEHIPRVRWITLSGAGHMSHLEGREQLDKILKLVGEFLTPDKAHRV